MKASQLISILQHKIDQHGDLEVFPHHADEEIVAVEYSGEPTDPILYGGEGFYLLD